MAPTAILMYAEPMLSPSRGFAIVTVHSWLCGCAAGQAMSPMADGAYGQIHYVAP